MLLGLLLAVVLILFGLYLSARARASAQPPAALAAAASAPGSGLPVVDARRLDGPMIPSPVPAQNGGIDSDGGVPSTDPDPTPSPASDQTPRSPINLNALNRLRAVDQNDSDQDDRAPVLSALIDAFCRAGPDQLDALNAALAHDDPIPALTTLGLFRTSARLLGARDLEALAGRLQSNLDARNTAAATRILHAMRVEFGTVTVALHAFAAAA